MNWKHFDLRALPLFAAGAFCLLHFMQARALDSLLNSETQKLQTPEPSPAIAAPIMAYKINLDSLYQDALAAAEKGNWMQAVVTLEKLQLLQPNYRDVIDRLAAARANLGKAVASGAAAQIHTNDSSAFPIGSAIAAGLLASLLGFMFFSPCARIYYYHWHGDFAAAVMLYEQILARHPSKIKIYPKLANLYLLLGRRDEKALKVYQTVLQLNLRLRNREEINALVAQNYLLEGRTDTDAIAVLESALAIEQRKVNHPNEEQAK